MLRRWTWRQVQLAAECIVGYELDKLNMVVEPLLKALGIDYEPGKVGDKGRKGKGRPTDIDWNSPEAVARAEQRDAALLGAFRGMGVTIHDDPP